ncbi:MAG: hypothetical protein IPJ41_09880 [Phycisphaerales bacterium]|nr:hypothetical protein [Phycisphaerales bacterium]
MAPVVAPVVGWLARRRFPWLFGITLALFAADLVIPDVIPFADEVLLGLVAAVLAALRKRRRVPPDPSRTPDAR